MKCDELKAFDITVAEEGYGVGIVKYRRAVYDKSEADKVIADLKADYKEACDRRLRRALWLARANRAIEKIAWFKLWNASISTMDPEDGDRQEYDKWKKNLGKFFKKVEEYK